MGVKIRTKRTLGFTINQGELSLMDQNIHINELEKRLKALLSTPRPFGPPVDELDDADADLFVEEAHYVGLATRLIRGRSLGPYSDVSEPDQSIDVRLSNAIAKDPNNAALLALIDRRSKLLLMAQQVCELAKKQS